MLNLMRTHDAVDPQIQGCAKLLAAIIADAIHCAGSKPRPDEVEFEMSMNWESCDAARSIWFLFDHKSPFDLYAKLIGLEAEAIREALLDPSKNYLPKGEFSASQARIIRIRYQWFDRLRREVRNYERKMLELPGRDKGDPLAIKPTKPKKAEEPTVKPANSVWDFARTLNEPNPAT